MISISAGQSHIQFTTEEFCIRFRKPLLYPQSYGGLARCHHVAGCFCRAHRTGYPHKQSVSMTGMPRPIVMDVDTGTDDALAILYAVRHPDLQLLGITCVAGNVSVDQAVLNTCKVLDAARARDIPVAAGAAEPLNGAWRTQGQDPTVWTASAGSPCQRRPDSDHRCPRSTC